MNMEINIVPYCIWMRLLWLSVVLFGMYADDSYSYVQKEEMDRLVLESEGQISVALSDLFQEVKIIETLPESIYIGKHDQFFA